MRKTALAGALLLFVLTALAALTSPIAAAAAAPGPDPAGPRGLAITRAAVAQNIPSRLTTSSAPVACDGAFAQVSSPNGTGHNDIFATSAISPTDIWAVGVQTTASTSPVDKTLAMHWDGTRWTIIPTPNPGPSHNDLNGVAAITTNDVWAVGDYYDPVAHEWLYFALHWNGSGWTNFISPQLGFLFGVTALASNNVWAVGTSAFFPTSTVILHWDGFSWNQVSSPNLGGFDNELFYVSAFNATDIWATGEAEFSNGAPLQSLAEHWDGVNWNVVSTGNDTGSNVIGAVAALEAGHAVGVGYGGFTFGVSSAHGEYWNLQSGGGSTNFALSGPGTGDNLFNAVAVSGSSVWAVGFWRATGSSPRQTMAWPGTWNSTSHLLTWGSIGTSASPGSKNNVLFAVTAVSPSSFWATGYNNSGAYDASLIESVCSLKLGITASVPTVTKGSSFSVTVTAKNGDNTTKTDYAGTVHFTSSDGAAVLPLDYAFTGPDAGVHTFSGVVLNTPDKQTITVNDLITNFVSASTSVTVFCPGACSAPGGTAPGGRSANPSSGGSPASRSVNQSTGGAPPGPIGTRIPQGPPASRASTQAAPARSAVGSSAHLIRQAAIPKSPKHVPLASRPIFAASLNAAHPTGLSVTTPDAKGSDWDAVTLLLLLPSLWLLWMRTRKFRRLHANSRT